MSNVFGGRKTTAIWFVPYTNVTIIDGYDRDLWGHGYISHIVILIQGSILDFTTHDDWINPLLVIL